MIFISADDFFEKVSAIPRLSRDEEIELARRMAAGDAEARTRLIEGYLPVAAARIRRLPRRFQTLGMVLYCVHYTARAVDSFDFFQDSEPFVHRLNWRLRNAVAAYIVR